MQMRGCEHMCIENSPEENKVEELHAYSDLSEVFIKSAVGCMSGTSVVL